MCWENKRQESAAALASPASRRRSYRSQSSTLNSLSRLITHIWLSKPASPPDSSTIPSTCASLLTCTGLPDDGAQAASTLLFSSSAVNQVEPVRPFIWPRPWNPRSSLSRSKFPSRELGVPADSRLHAISHDSFCGRGRVSSRDAATWYRKLS